MGASCPVSTFARVRRRGVLVLVDQTAVIQVLIVGMLRGRVLRTDALCVFFIFTTRVVT